MKMPLVESFYQNNYERRVGLIHGWTEEFVAFVEKRYGFRPTWDELRIVQFLAEAKMDCLE